MSDYIDYISAGILIFIITLVAVYLISGKVVQNKCLVNGYPNHRVSWALKGYCVKEVNETEIVVPSGELE